MTDEKIVATIREWFGDQDVANCVLESEQSIKDWLDRAMWFVENCKPVEQTIDQILEIIHELEQDNIGSEAHDIDYNVACRDIRDRIKATQMFEEMIDDGVFAEGGEQE